MKKIIAVQGSPHKGNTFDRVERFGSALEALGGVRFEHIALKDLRIEPCRGCFMCFEKGKDACPIRDDKPELDRKLEEADGVVFATPVYSMHISYLLKRFVDRFAYNFHRPPFFGKHAVGLAVTAGIGLDEALKYIRMFAGTWGFEYQGDLRYIAAPRGTRLAEIPPFSREKDRTRETALRLHRAVTDNPPRKLTKNDYLHFHAMRTVYGRLKEQSPTDYAFWKEKGWLDPRNRWFISHVRGNVLKSVFPRLMARLMARQMDRNAARKADSSGNES